MNYAPTCNCNTFLQNTPLLAALGYLKNDKGNLVPSSSNGFHEPKVWFNPSFQNVYPEGVKEIYLLNYGRNDENVYNNIPGAKETIARGVFLLEFTDETNTLLMGLDKSYPIDTKRPENVKDLFNNYSIISEEKENGEALRVSTTSHNNIQYFIFGSKNAVFIVDLPSFVNGSFLSKYFGDSDNNNNTSFKIAQAFHNDLKLRDTLIKVCLKHVGGMISGEIIFQNSQHITSKTFCTDNNGVKLYLFTVTYVDNDGFPSFYMLDNNVPLCVNRKYSQFETFDSFLDWCRTKVLSVDHTNNETLTSEGDIIKFVDDDNRIICSLKLKSIVYELLRKIRELKPKEYALTDFQKEILKTYSNKINIRGASLINFIKICFEVLSDSNNIYKVVHDQFRSDNRYKFIQFVDTLLEINAFDNLDFEVKKVRGEYITPFSFFFHGKKEVKKLDNFPKVVIVTGGSCSGKSSFSGYLRKQLEGQFNLLVLDSDIDSGNSKYIQKELIKGNYNIVIISACTVGAAKKFLPEDIQLDITHVVMAPLGYNTYVKRFFGRNHKIAGGFKEAREIYNNQRKTLTLLSPFPSAFYSYEEESFQHLAERIFPDYIFDKYVPTEQNFLNILDEIQRIYYHLDEKSYNDIYNLFELPFNNFTDELHITLLNLGKERKSRIPEGINILSSNTKIEVIGLATFDKDDQHFVVILVSVNGKTIRKSDGGIYHITISTTNVPSWKIGSMLKNGDNITVKDCEPFIINGSIGVERAAKAKNTNNNNNRNNNNNKNNSNEITCYCCGKTHVTFSKKMRRLFTRSPTKTICTNCNGVCKSSCNTNI